MSNNLTVQGAVVIQPELKEFANGKLYTFAVYDNERRKNKESGEWENVPGSALKLKVNLWNDQAEKYEGEIQKGDIVRVVGRVTQRDYDDNGKTRTGGLETAWVESIEVVARPESGGSSGF